MSSSDFHDAPIQLGLGLLLALPHRWGSKSQLINVKQLQVSHELQVFWAQSPGLCNTLGFIWVLAGFLFPGSRSPRLGGPGEGIWKHPCKVHSGLFQHLTADGGQINMGTGLQLGFLVMFRHRRDWDFYLFFQTCSPDIFTLLCALQ